MFSYLAAAMLRCPLEDDCGRGRLLRLRQQSEVPLLPRWRLGHGPDAHVNGVSGDEDQFVESVPRLCWLVHCLLRRLMVVKNWLVFVLPEQVGLRVGADFPLGWGGGVGFGVRVVRFF